VKIAVKKPNILLITTDQQRYDTVGAAAPDFMRTPHTDFLMREGVTFENCYVQSPACVPSRMSMMTGMSPQALGLYNNSGARGLLDGNARTMPRVMNDLGYHTIAVGKMHFDPERARHGFQEMILPRDYYNKMAKSGQPLQPMRHGLGQNEMYPGMATVPEAMTLTSFITEECVEYIENRRDPDVPFFMWCSYSKPHPPLDPPEPYYSMYRQSPIKPPVCGQWAQPENAPESFNRFRQKWSTDLLPAPIIKEARAAYYGLITQCDYNMGRIFSALQDIGELNNTLIIYTSDHGEFLGDHQAVGKFFPYEQSIHVPFVLRPPKSMAGELAGTHSHQLVSLMDILPTIAKFAGGDADEFEGKDLFDLATQHETRTFLTGAYLGDGDYIYLVQGRYKYIYYPEDAREQLFDIVDDREDMVDLAGDTRYAATLEDMRHMLLQEQKARGSKFVESDAFVKLPIADDTEQERRAGSWPGFHTEYCPMDVLH
jgi:arylsulfatase A-like enzyme